MREFTVYDLCWLYIEDSEEMTIWDLATETEVFKGTYDEAMSSDYSDYSVCSYGVENGIVCINIRTTD